MARMFYLSLVHNNDLYNRDDMLKRESLRELDEIISNFANREEILKSYYPNYKKGKTEGKVCIVYEDLDLKSKYLKEIDGLSPDRYNDVLKDYDYAHIIPILYKSKKMVDIKSCINSLNARKNRWETIRSIMFNELDKKGDIIAKTNKRYIFELGEEKRLIEEDRDYRGALNWFAKRVEKASEEDQYFYFRTLINILHLSVSIIQSKVGKIIVHKENIKDTLIDEKDLTMRYRDIMTEKDRLMADAEDMETFYQIHDLDDAIKLSPWKNRPIGGKERK